MLTFGLVVNPNAKYHRTRPLARQQMISVCERSSVRTLYGDSHSPSELTAIAERFCAANVDVLGISGGDGTGSMTLSAFRRVYGQRPLPAVALLRGGTMNTVANSLGVPRLTPPELLRRALSRCSQRRVETRTTDSMLVNERDVGFLFGVGTVHAFLRAYYDAGDSQPTPTTALRVLGRGVGSAVIGGAYARTITSRVNVAVTVDGEHWPLRDYFTVAAGAIDQIGLGFKPFHAKERQSQGFFHVVGWTLTIPQFARALPKIWRKRPLGPAAGWDRRATHLELTAPDDKPLGYMLDGDLRQHVGTLRVSLGPSVEMMVL